MRWLSIAVLAGALAACGEREPARPPSPPPAAEQAQPAAPAPDMETETASPDRTAEPSAPRYVGLWAVDRRLCDNPAWRFEADGVSTLGEVSCDFDRVRERPGGYVIDATCTAEAPPAPFQIELTVNQSGRAMSVAGGPWAEGIGLVLCRPR